MGAPSEKSQKYDRQLRLWGDHGQAMLESAKLCLINATATGCEILKNLILPGIGSFSIIDEHSVTEEDLGNNFFLTDESLGQKRGQVATTYLQELNDEVLGEFIEEGLDTLLRRNPEIFSKFTLVIVSSLPSRSLLTLSEYLWAHDVPLVICCSYGMIGYLRLVSQNHTVVEAHPEHPHPDLRLTKPFPELVEFCDSIKLDGLSKKDHSHIPWLVLLYKYLQIYKSQNNGDVPTSYKQKNAFKEIIRQGILRNEDGIPEDEENFQEAIAAVNTALHETKVTSSLQVLLAHSLACEITGKSSNFWILCQALKEFIDCEGCLPLQGSIPDMTADSKTYIALQHIYKNKANQHINQMHEKANEIKLLSQGCEHPSPTRLPSETITIDSVRLFCRNISNLSLVNCRSLELEFNAKTTNTQLLAHKLEDVSGNDYDVAYYVMLRAADEFYKQYNKLPGWYDDQIEADIPLLKVIVNKLLSDTGLTLTIEEDYIHEFCSYGGAEIHSIAAFMGGVAAQEIIKLITGQYKPIQNTYIYNGCTQNSLVLDL